MKALSLILIIILSNSYADEPQPNDTIKTIDLDFGMSFELISNSIKREVGINLLQGFTENNKRLLERHAFYNSDIIDDGCEKVKFNENINSYLITIWNYTSNYGARTGVIIYKNKWWDLFILPFDTFDIVDTNNDDIMEIKHNDDIYAFNDGILVPQEK